MKRRKLYFLHSEYQGRIDMVRKNIESERTKHRTIRDALGWRSVGGCAVVDVDELYTCLSLVRRGQCWGYWGIIPGGKEWFLSPTSCVLTPTRRSNSELWDQEVPVIIKKSCSNGIRGMCYINNNTKCSIPKEECLYLSLFGDFSVGVNMKRLISDVMLFQCVSSCLLRAEFGWIAAPGSCISASARVLVKQIRNAAVEVII